MVLDTAMSPKPATKCVRLQDFSSGHFTPLEAWQFNNEYLMFGWQNGDTTNSSAPLSLLLEGMKQGRAVLEDRYPLDRFHWEQSYTVSGDRSTLSSHDQTRYAVWDAGACRQERDPHDDIRDSQSVADYSHLKETQRHMCCGFNDHSGQSEAPLLFQSYGLDMQDITNRPK